MRSYINESLHAGLRGESGYGHIVVSLDTMVVAVRIHHRFILYAVPVLFHNEIVGCMLLTSILL
jgi:hypothetical protein